MSGFSLKIIALYSPIFVSFIWGITLFFKNYKSQNPGYLMSFVQLSAFCVFLGITPFYHGNVLLSVKLEPIFTAGLLSIFPFVYFYVRFITTKQRIKPSIIYQHLIPAAILSLNSLLIQFTLTPNEQLIYAQRAIFSTNQHWLLYYFTNIEWLIRFVLIFQSIFYLYKSAKLIRSFKNNVRSYFSNIQGRFFNWIHIFYFIFGVSLLASIPPLIAGNSYLSQADSYLSTISFFTLSLVFYIISYLADNHSYIEDEDFYFEDVLEQPARSNKLQKKLAKQVEDYFIEYKPYLSNELKINEIAVALGTNRTYISDSIKVVFHSNFNKYVNMYRVEEAIVIFKDPANDDLSTIEISEQVGFHTYNSFIKGFKKSHKCTPAVYRKKISLFQEEA